MIEIHIAEDFSRAPAGRCRNDGPRSGEAFRQEHLAPALREADKVVVHLDGVEGYGSAFLEEAFGGLVRVEGFSSEELRRSLIFDTGDDALKYEIGEYINPPSSD